MPFTPNVENVLRAMGYPAPSWDVPDDMAAGVAGWRAAAHDMSSVGTVIDLTVDAERLAGEHQDLVDSQNNPKATMRASRALLVVSGAVGVLTDAVIEQLLGTFALKFDRPISSESPLYFPLGPYGIRTASTGVALDGQTTKEQGVISSGWVTLPGNGWDIDLENDTFTLESREAVTATVNATLFLDQVTLSNQNWTRGVRRLPR